MNILPINPNTSAHVTARMLDAVRSSMGTFAQMVGVTGWKGRAVAGSRTENALAGAHALELAAEHVSDVDAVVLGISTDAGLSALRELLDVPVAGMLEAALMSAAQLGGRIGVLTLGERMLPLYQEQAQAYGMGSRVVAWCGATIPALYTPKPGLEVIDLLCEQALALIEQHKLDDLIFSGAVLAGYRARYVPFVRGPAVRWSCGQRLGTGGCARPACSGLDQMAQTRAMRLIARKCWEDENTTARFAAGAPRMGQTGKRPDTVTVGLFKRPAQPWGKDRPKTATCSCRGR